MLYLVRVSLSSTGILDSLTVFPIDYVVDGAEADPFPLVLSSFLLEFDSRLWYKVLVLLRFTHPRFSNGHGVLRRTE